VKVVRNVIPSQTNTMLGTVLSVAIWHKPRSWTTSTIKRSVKRSWARPRF
jgi:hypothetical protein